MNEREALHRFISRAGSLDHEEYRALVFSLRNWLCSVLHLSEQDAEEVSATALFRLFDVYRKGQLTSEGNLVPLLRRIARNAGIDMLRRNGRTSHEPYSDVGLGRSHPTDDNVARRFNQSADARSIKDALAVAIERRDKLLIRVVTFSLNTIEATGELPTMRQIGEAVGVSHTAVRGALARFRRDLEQVGVTSEFS